jgi:hypothetical protein
MKKIIAISGLALAVAACGGTASPTSSALKTSATSTPTAAPTTAAAIATPTQASTPADTVTAAASAPVTTSAAAATPAGASADPLVSQWTVDLGDPSVVSIAPSGSGYAITIVDESESMGADCDLPGGTVFATFTASGTDTYSAKEGTWSRSASGTCSFSGWVAEKLTLTTAPTYKLTMPSTDSNDPLPLTFYKA